MGLFKKKPKKGEPKKNKSEFERLPELPKLPEFPEFEKSKKKEQLPRLPKFPDNSFGERFSQNTIREAVTGEKEEDEEVPEADEFVSRNERMMPQPLNQVKRPSTRPVPVEFREAAKKVKTAEPIFIRIDKFEESLHAFEKAKQQVTEIEKMLKNIKHLKEEEEKELGMWEREIQSTRQQIEKIDQDIFSKVE